MPARIDVRPEILIWAIARAGYELPEFADKDPRVYEWIEGEKKPTVKQLEDFSKKVYIPFGYLLLPEPTEEDLPTRTTWP